MDSLQPNEALINEPLATSENSDVVKKAKRVLSEKNAERWKLDVKKDGKESLKRSRMKRSRIKQTKNLYTKPSLEDESSSSSLESSKSDVPPEPVKVQKKKN